MAGEGTRGMLLEWREMGGSGGKADVGVPTGMNSGVFRSCLGFPAVELADYGRFAPFLRCIVELAVGGNGWSLVREGEFSSLS